MRQMQANAHTGAIHCGASQRSRRGLHRSQTRNVQVNANTILERIRRDVAARPESAREGRHRRDRVLKAARGYLGTLRTYPAGSLATRFANDPVSDADSGVVMDRRKLPELGPDGQGKLPAELVDSIGGYIRPLLARQYPSVSVERMKRGLLICFSKPLQSGEDPSVDLVVALNRAEDDALWIPNSEKNRWDPSHPEKHVELFTSGSEKLRQTRRHVVRVAKAQVQQFDDPHICSFNIAALAWECIKSYERLDRALHRFYNYAAAQLSRHLTPDPANVSEPIKVDDRELAVKRLRRTADGLRRAIETGNDPRKAQAELAAEGVFWKLIPFTKDRQSSRVVEAVRENAPVSVMTNGTLITGTPSRHAVPVKSTRAYGHSEVIVHSEGYESDAGYMTPARRSSGSFV